MGRTTFRGSRIDVALVTSSPRCRTAPSGLVRRFTRLAALAAVLALAAPATADLDVAGNLDDVRIRQLELQVARDQARLQELLTEVRDPEIAPLHRDSEMLELARRLPDLQRELRHRLARQRAQRAREQRAREERATP